MKKSFLITFWILIAVSITLIVIGELYDKSRLLSIGIGLSAASVGAYLGQKYKNKVINKE